MKAGKMAYIDNFISIQVVGRIIMHRDIASSIGNGPALVRCSLIGTLLARLSHCPICIDRGLYAIPSLRL